MEINTIGNSVTKNNFYTLILRERDGERALPIIIGGFEAHAIVLAFEQIKGQRPFTHDLFVNFIEHSEIELKEILINDYKGEIFYAELHCITKDGSTLVVDSRPSDAIALAVRVGCPILIYENVLMAAIKDLSLPFKGYEISDESSEAKKEEDEAMKFEAAIEDPLKLKDKTLAELETMLEEVIEKEDYDTAIIIRDEINNRK